MNKENKELTLDDRIDNLITQQEEARVLLLKLAGAIEVLQDLKKSEIEKAESEFPEED